MPTIKKLFFPFIAIALVIAAISFNSCGVYSFADVSIPDSIKTVRINIFQNRAQYINPQLSPTHTDRVRQCIVNQTRLAQTLSDDAHYDINGTITNYSISTSGISSGNNNQRQASMNNLNITVQIELNNRLTGEVTKYDVTRAFPFNANLSLQSAEAQMLDEIVRNLSDDIFNRIFSNW
ncbi:MAG: LPS assembly lipoprotein LptE [Chitinophagaceae bacterium]